MRRRLSACSGIDGANCAHRLLSGGGGNSSRGDAGFSKNSKGRTNGDGEAPKPARGSGRTARPNLVAPDERRHAAVDRRCVHCAGAAWQRGALTGDKGQLGRKMKNNAIGKGEREG